MMYKVFSLLLFALYSLVGCTTPNGVKPSVVGKYGVYRPHRGEQMALEGTMKAQVYPLSEGMIYLREDNTYVLGYCDYQIRESGQYQVDGDSIFFFDRYDFKEQGHVPDQKMFFSYSKEILYFLKPILPAMEAYRQPNSKGLVMPLKKNYWKSHNGFLRDEAMSLDSIKCCYVPHLLVEQMRWHDSMKVIKAKR